MNIQINDGDSFVNGRSREKAQELLDRAEEMGISANLVRTTSNGYIVPSGLLEEKPEKAEDAKGESAPAADTKVDGEKAAEASAEAPEAKPAGKGRTAAAKETNTKGEK